MPDRAGSLSELREFLPPGAPDLWAAAATWVLSALCLPTHHLVLELFGPHGSGKTQVARCLTQLIDSRHAEVRNPPESRRDLAAAAANAYVLSFDNLSKVTRLLADELCRVTDGAGSGGRRLFTDADEAMVVASRPLILTSISEVAGVHADLGDRSLLVQLPSIPIDERRGDRELRSAFEAARPRLLGGLLHAAAEALANLPHADNIAEHRRADSVRLATAASSALCLGPGELAGVLRHSQALVDAAGLETPVATAVMVVAEAGGWEGTTGALLEEIRVRHPGPGLPTNARGLGAELRRLQPQLRRAGVEVEELRRGAGGYRIRIGLRR